MSTLTGGEGTSSYHAEYVAEPSALQSASVPACSRLVDELELDIPLGSDHDPESDEALELEPEPEAEPPSPTQKEE